MAPLGVEVESPRASAFSTARRGRTLPGPGHAWSGPRVRSSVSRAVGGAEKLAERARARQELPPQRRGLISGLSLRSARAPGDHVRRRLRSPSRVAGDHRQSAVGFAGASRRIANCSMVGCCRGSRVLVRIRGLVERRRGGETQAFTLFADSFGMEPFGRAFEMFAPCTIA